MSDSRINSRRLPALVAIVAASACLGFAAFTNHAWEDYYITFRSSLNLASGQGLVYQPGERVHTFTSPLGTLLPALFAGGGEGSDRAQRALWLFRLVSVAALAGAVGTAARVMTRAGLGALAIGAACLAWALDAKTVDFTINGMETALLVLFITLAWRALAAGARVGPTALAFGGLQWTRPDGVAWFGALALAWLAFGRADHSSRLRDRIPRLAQVVGLGLLIYAPWLIFTWLYYGTPVPHTIAAKVSHHPPGELAIALLLYPWRLLAGHTALHDVFMPSYYYFGGWPAGMPWAARLLSVGSALAWISPGLRSEGRIASAAFFVGGFYVEYIPRSPWYYPGWQALGFISWAYVLDVAIRTGDHSSRLRRALAPVARMFGATLTLGSLVLLFAVTVQMRTQQTLIEDGQRREIGLWLRRNATSRDRVYLEPLGYIGYFSGLKMLDYPGLASPEVVAARHAGHKPHAEIITVLQPEWLVLRADQVRATDAAAPSLLSEQYRLARVFDVRRAIDAIQLLPGRGFVEFDALYFVFKRTAAPHHSP